MLLLRRIALALLALLMAGLVAFYITPLDAYIPEIESRIGEQMQERVHVGGVRIGLFPIPHLELQNVRIGTVRGMQVDEVEIEPALTALLRGELVLHRIGVTGGEVHLAVLQGWLDRLIHAPLAVSMRISELQFRGVSLIAGGLTLKGVEGKVELAGRDQLQRIWLAMDDQKLVLTAVPVTQGAVMHRFPPLAFVVRGTNWLPPAVTRLPLMDSIDASGVVDEGVIDVSSFKLVSASARAEGRASLDSGERWRTNVDLKQGVISLPQAMAWLDYPIISHGTFQARGVLQSEGTSLGEIRRNMRFTGGVSFQHADVDLVKEAGSPFVVESLDAQVVMDASSVQASDVKANLYGGQMTGVLALERSTLVLNGQGDVKNLNMQPLIAALSSEVLLSGQLGAQTKFNLQLREFGKFPANVRLQADFQMRDGALQKIDLEQAAKHPGKNYVNQGMTRFDRLKGNLLVDGLGYHFRQIIISSGSLNAEGRLDMAPNLTLTGMLDADVKGTAGLVSMPMVIGGTVDNPSVNPSGTALAGAAVGTAILGPGLGTALGVRVGGFLHKLFSNGDDTSVDGKSVTTNKSVKHPKP